MSNRGKKLKKELGGFLKQYQRKSHKGHDPNDRSYDREIEQLVKSLPAEELDELMRGQGGEINEAEEREGFHYENRPMLQ